MLDISLNDLLNLQRDRKQVYILDQLKRVVLDGIAPTPQLTENGVTGDQFETRSGSDARRQSCPHAGPRNATGHSAGRRRVRADSPHGSRILSMGPRVKVGPEHDTRLALSAF